MTKNNFFIRTISLVLSIVILLTTLVSCGIGSNINSDTDLDSVEFDSDIISDIVSDILSDIESDSELDTGSDLVSDLESDSNTDIDSDTDSNTDADDLVDNGYNQVVSLLSNSTEISTTPDDYVGDLDVFTYGIIITALELYYDVFTASVVLSTGKEIFGIAYTDYSSAYLDEEDGRTYISTGFMPLIGQTAVEDDEFEKGLLVYDLAIDEETFEYSYVWEYKSGAYKEHCVVFNNYLVYGVDESGAVFNEYKPYVRGECDEDIGSLYSYDEGRNVYLSSEDVGGEYVPLKGESITDEIDFDELAKQATEAINNQNINFAEHDIETYVYEAKAAVDAFLLSLQEETFLGWSVQDLIAQSQNLDPLECLRITEDGLKVIDIEKTPPPQADKATRWLVGISCAVISILAMVVSAYCPYLKPVMGALQGAAMDILFQVAVNATTLDNIDWRKVALSAVMGAIGSAVSMGFGKIDSVGKAIGATVVDAFLGGTESAIITAMDGGDLDESIKSFGTGAVVAGLISGVFNFGEFGINKAIDAKKASQSAKNVANNSKKTGSAVKGAADDGTGNVIKKSKSTLKEIDDDTLGAAVGAKKKADIGIDLDYDADTSKPKVSRKKIQAVNERLFKKGVKNAPKSFVDEATGETINFNNMTDKLDYFRNKADGIVGYIEGDDGVFYIIKKESKISALGDPKKFSTTTIDGMTANRNINIPKAIESFKKDWLNNIDSMPPEVKNGLIQEFAGSSVEEALEGCSITKLTKIINQHFEVHELIDLKTVQLIPKSLHKSVSHMGGRSLAEFIETYFGTQYLSKYVQAAKSIFGGIA